MQGMYLAVIPQTRIVHELIAGEMRSTDSSMLLVGGITFLYTQALMEIKLITNDLQ